MCVQKTKYGDVAQYSDKESLNKTSRTDGPGMNGPRTVAKHASQGHTSSVALHYSKFVNIIIHIGNHGTDKTFNALKLLKDLMY
jgi:hypothetical protein